MGRVHGSQQSGSLSGAANTSLLPGTKPGSALRRGSLSGFLDRTTKLFRTRHGQFQALSGKSATSQKRSTALAAEDAIFARPEEPPIVTSSEERRGSISFWGSVLSAERLSTPVARKTDKAARSAACETEAHADDAAQEAMKKLVVVERGLVLGACFGLGVVHRSHGCARDY